MFLKSLSLKGFKSFADATTMELEPGVTVVVGPNGSGKSNVVDAIAWVLGAQAPSAVRSQKMDDVIFAGTATRPALGRAEVSLTIDNSAGILPIEFSEVTVRRTLFRNGDSEYAINNVPCRLLDVQELLSDAGVGTSTARHRQPGPDRCGAERPARGAASDHRGGRRRPQVPQAQGEGRTPPRRHRGQPAACAGPAARGSPPAAAARAPGRGREAPRRLVAELGTLRMYVAGREIAALRTRLTTLAAAKHQSAADETRLKSELAQLDADVVALGAELSARGADDVSDRLACGRPASRAGPRVWAR